MTLSSSVTLRRLLFAATVLATPLIAVAPGPAAAQAVIGVSVQIAPPFLPVYVQPAMPDAGYIWTPGYWAWGQPVGYYWVPGTWVLPPVADVLWTPPYWGWNNGVYLFHDGYWGSHVGYYGGINYGFGYGGDGYGGGRWQNGTFAYNRTVNNFGSVHVQNDYAANVAVLNTSQVSYNGGTGGLRTAPTAEQHAFEAERHLAMTSEQSSHIAVAARTPELAASRNGGRPAIAATARPGQFEGSGVAAAGEPRAGDHVGLAETGGRPAAAGARPEMHAFAAPAAHEAARATAQPVEHAAAAQAPARPAQQHAAARAVPQHDAPRPIQHAVARPAEAHPAAVRAAAPRPAPAHEAEHREEKR